MYGDPIQAYLFAWKFTLSGSARQLAPPWAASVIVAQFDARTVVIAANNAPPTTYLYVAATGGTTGTTTPTGTTGSVTDNGVTWQVYPLAGARWLTLVDIDGSSLALIGDNVMQLAPAPPNYGSLVVPNSPGLYYASSTGTPVLTVVATT